MAQNDYGSDWFWPYGRGPRACSGQGFSELYIKTTLATILADSKFEVGKGQDYDCKVYFTVATPQNLRARFTAG